MKNALIQDKEADTKLLKIVALIDYCEGYAHPHASRVAAVAAAVAQRFYLSSYDISILHQAALIHDLGELIMKRDYIKSSEKLTVDERLDVQRHPVIGEQEAAKRDFPRAVQLLVRWHHEWWNGAGYPDALRGEQIPLTARILRVADTYCALTDDRTFRFAFSETEAKKHLIEWAGIEFDPLIVKHFLALPDFEELKSFADKKDW